MTFILDLDHSLFHLKVLISPTTCPLEIKNLISNGWRFPLTTINKRLGLATFLIHNSLQPYSLQTLFLLSFKIRVLFPLDYFYFLRVLD